MDIAQVITNLIVGAASAWIAGYFGVHRALQQAKQQRGFDRRLEWYEKAVRATLKFQTHFAEVALAAKNLRTHVIEERLHAEQKAILDTMGQIRAESLVFADRATYVQLKRIFKEYGRRIDEVGLFSKLESATDEAEFSQGFEGLAKLIERASFELACSIRRQLGLDEITIQDVEQ